MYIQKAEIKNIRSIIDFEIDFKNPAGWHVLIGDNGAGKSTIIRSIALVLIGENQAQGLRANWNDWLNRKEMFGFIKLTLSNKLVGYEEIPNHLNFTRFDSNKEVGLSTLYIDTEIIDKSKTPPLEDILNNLLQNKGGFSVAFGPYRRFEGGNSEWEEVYKNPSLATLAAHLSVFNESVALTEPIKWLKELNYKSLEKNKESIHTIENLKKLINSDDFLPHNSRLKSINSDDVFFKDSNGLTIAVNQMSDGYRSILSMTFELIRQLVRVYGSELVFKNIEKGEMFIDLPGVVLVDEIDAHLHPTWQTRIGQWFLKYFPKLQFIVTTHSPLVCRAAENGSIWRLAAPGSDEKSGEITGLDRERLIYGNILDAYGTEAFGDDVSISQDSVEKQEEMVKLSKKKMLDAISPEEEEKLQDLKKVFTTDAPIEL
jgi:predicted ATP-binding protein involved in virulence